MELTEKETTTKRKFILRKTVAKKLRKSKVTDSIEDKPCPGSKIRSGGAGRGLGIGKR